MGRRVGRRVKSLQPLADHRLLVQGTIDSLAWAGALTFGTVVRYDLHPRVRALRGLAVIIPISAVVVVLAGLGCGLYTGRRRFGSFDEVAALARATVLTMLVTIALDVTVTHPRHLVPISAAIAAAPTALVLMAGARYVWRLFLEARRRPSGDGCRPLLVFGAGEGGAQVITAMLRDPGSPYLPVALLDDDPRRRHLQIMGVRVVGGRAELAAAAEEYGADVLLIAIPSATADVIRQVTDVAAEAGLAVKVLPAVGELFDDRVGVGDIRDVSPADLLGRHQVQIDIDAIAGYLTGRRVLVTGAGGSIGAELCRQIDRFAPAELVMLDHDESALRAVQLTLDGRAPLDAPNLALVDLRDRERLGEVLARHRPHVVFHAAALKHVALLEQNPSEAVKTNVIGTLDLLELTARTGVARFVNISTDKAADPCGVLGYSKRIGERVTSWFSSRGNGTYLSVRFGNVLGSRGSVLSVFRAQLDAGGPLTVTHPDATRYFMTVEEAVQLVIQAGAIGRPGEALVLDMGEPVRIHDVAQRMAATGDQRVDVVYTGLRPGEKLHEVLLGTGEHDHRPVHPLISHVPVAPLDPNEVRGIDVAAAPDEIIGQLVRLTSGSRRTTREPR